MARIELNLYPAAVEAMIGRHSDRAAKRAADATRDRAKANLVRAGRVNTGKLLRSIHTFNRTAGRDRAVYAVGSALHYAGWQEEGVKGPIFPKRAKVLRFKPKGSATFIFRPSVKGFAGAFYLRDAYRSLSRKDFLP